MLKHVNGKERFGDEEERQKEVPATDKHPTPAANEARLRSALSSIAGIWKLRAPHHDAISIFLTLSNSSTQTKQPTLSLFLGSLLLSRLILPKLPLSQALIYHYGPFKWMGSKVSWAGPSFTQMTGFSLGTMQIAGTPSITFEIPFLPFCKTNMN